MTKTVRKIFQDCNLCGSPDHAELYPDELGDRPPRLDYDFSPETRKTYRIVKCRGCGLVFVNPMPDLRPFYRDVADPVYLASLDQRRFTAERSLKRILRHKNHGALLDIGCATGAFLDAASAHFSTEGVELSAWARQIAARHHLVHATPLSDMDLAERYDVVTMWDVIEHLTNPAIELRAIARALRPGGLIVIYTGDVDAAVPRLLGKSWWWFQGMHLFYFSRRTCAQMLTKAGFEIIETGTFTKHFRLRSLGDSFRRYRLGRLLARILSLPGLGRVMVPLRLSGEMLIIARRG